MQQFRKLPGEKLLFVLLFMIGLLVTGSAFAQQHTNTDSLRQERIRLLEATRIARQQAVDSARTARLRYADSLKVIRQHRADSLELIRKYRESKRFKDSVAAVRQARADSIKAVRTAYFDSVRMERKRVTDSAFAVRKAYMDSVSAVRKKRTDSLAVIRQYRESKRYKDSVAFTRQQRIDSLRQVRKEFNDSMTAVRIHVRDSAIAARKAYSDSLRTERKKITDSLAAIRKIRTDSLAKKREEKEKMRGVQEKKRKDQAQLAFELKIKKKREAWNNEKMRKRKWHLPRKVLQNTVTRYNYYFNADRKMDEAIDNMLRMRQESYDSLITLFPFNPDIDSTMLASDMDSIIQKASLGIQIHDPRTKWADDLYLLLGQAYYYKGNYEQASTAFRYIISMNQREKREAEKAAGKRRSTEVSVVEKDEKTMLDFMKHKPANNEAILWLSRTYTQWKKPGEAESILDLLENDVNMPENLKGRLALEKAFLHLSGNKTGDAAGDLAVVAADETLPKWVRLRAAYLNGQLLYERQQYLAASASFQQTLALNPALEMDFYARKNIAYCAMQEGGDQEATIASLEKMLKDGKYLNYYEQVHYMLGRLSVNSGNTAEAIAWLTKSVQSVKSTRKQKALSFAALGNVYYAISDFRAAKNAYDSASQFARHAPADPDMEIAVRRAATVDKLVEPLDIIHAEDSLLALAAMTDKEKRAAIRQYLRVLEKQIADSISRAEIAAAEGAMPEQQDMGSGGSSFTSWYFSSPALIKQGYNDFRKKWGSRPDVDNWRRGRSLRGNAGHSGSSSDGSTSGEGSGNTDANGLPTEEFLLAAIPTTKAQVDSSRARIRKAYLAVANAYVVDLEDYSGGSTSLDTMEHRFPDHEYKPDVLYLRYLIALKQDKLPEAQAFSAEIRKSYPQTSWATLVTPAADNSKSQESQVSVINFYDETYGLMMQRDYIAVLQRARTGQQQYQDSVFKNRFRIMEAIALTGTGDFNQADSLLTGFISTRGTDSLRIWAETILEYVRKHKPVQPVAGDATLKTSDTTLAVDMPPLQIVDTTTKQRNDPPPPISYTYQPKDPHYFVFYFKKAESRAMGVRAALKDFNTFKYSGQQLTTHFEMLQETQGVILVQSFSSAAHAKIYINAVQSNKLILKEYNAGEYRLMSISADNYRKLQMDKNIEPYLLFYSQKYK